MIETTELPSEARIYKVPLLLGPMRLPVVSVVVALDEAEAVGIARGDGRFTFAPGSEIEELGTAHDPTPRLVF